MKHLTIILLLCSAVCNATSSRQSSQAQFSETVNAEQQGFVLNNVNIIDVENQQILPAKSLVVQNGKISAIGPTLIAGAHPTLKLIDGKGGYVTPGLIDMHVHMYEKAAYLLTLSHGVTHVRIMNGIPAQLKWRDNIASGKLLGSTSTVSSPIISGYIGAHLHHGVDSAQQAKAAVKQYHEMGYDLIKAYGNLNEDALTALLEQAKDLGMPVAKHGPHASGNMLTGELTGMQSLEHVEDIYQGPLNYQFEPQLLPPIIEELKATGVPITPTLNIYYQLTQLSAEKSEYLDKTHKSYTSRIIALEASMNQVDRWLTASDNMVKHNQKTLKFLQLISKQLNDQDVRLLVGSDSGVLLSPHGIATHTEMRLMEEAGITTYDVLAAATINPAKALQLDDKIGKIALNMQADFIFTQANPMDDLSVLQASDAVIKNGQWYSREQLDQLREKAIDSRSFWDEAMAIFEAL